MNDLATIISFCTNDIRFLDRCVRSVEPFSKQIVIPVCDHFYDGTKENRKLLDQVYQTYPHIDFIEFAYSTETLYGTAATLEPGSPGWSQHWHSTARLIGTYFLQESIEWVLFVDVDEIFERAPPPTTLDAIRYASYWYFKDAKTRATTLTDHPLLVRRSKLSHDILLDPDERMGIYYRVEGEKQRHFLVDNRPIVHHYSWVRSEEELEKKVECWGHHWERDWKSLLKEEGDYVRGYTYETVDPFWDPLKEPLHLKEAKPPFPNLKKVDAKDILFLELLQMSRS